MDNAEARGTQRLIIVYFNAENIACLLLKLGLRKRLVLST